MFSICTGDRRYGRREFLRIGGLSLGGLSLADLIQEKCEKLLEQLCLPVQGG